MNFGCSSLKAEDGLSLRVYLSYLYPRNRKYNPTNLTVENYNDPTALDEQTVLSPLLAPLKVERTDAYLSNQHVKSYENGFIGR